MLPQAGPRVQRLPGAQTLSGKLADARAGTMLSDSFSAAPFPPEMTYRSLTARLLASFIGCALVAGCVPPDRQQHSRAFISYTAPTDKTRLRLAVKDLIDVKGEVTSAGSEFLFKHSPPAKEDAECLKIARERNVQIVGKTNLTELAVGVSGINQFFGTPRNPVSRRRNLIPGGSSSGSAVAVADDLADVAFGTDTAGSIRVPAACCGIAGLKTTFGLVSLKGVYPIAPTILDTVGPMARDVQGLVTGMDLLERGFAGKYQAASASHHGGRVKVGRLYLSGTNRRVDEAVDEALAKAGFEVVVLGEDFKKQWEQATKDGRTVAAASAWLSDLKFAKEPQVKPRTKAVFTLGSYEHRTNYRAALQRRLAWQATLRQLFEKVDYIALPTIQRVPWSVPLWGGTPAFEALVLGSQNTAAVNLAGNPALALPVPLKDEAVRVTSLQLVGPMGSEAALLRAGRLVEEGGQLNEERRGDQR
jgi:amidase